MLLVLWEFYRVPFKEESEFLREFLPAAGSKSAETGLVGEFAPTVISVFIGSDNGCYVNLRMELLGSKVLDDALEYLDELLLSDLCLSKVQLKLVGL